MSENKSYLIAGGAGFIGSHLVKYFLSSVDTKKVIIIDNFLTGTYENLNEVINDSRLEIINADITKQDILEKVTDHIDVVFHLAAIANPTDYENHPILSLQVNSIGNEYLIKLAKKLGASKYIFFSSSEVYGNYETLPEAGLNENCEGHLMLNQVRSPYAVGKSFGEEMAIHFSKENDLNYIIIRPFNVFGPNMDLKTNYGRVIPNFIKWALNNEPLVVNGDGSQVRAFCYITDFVDAIGSLLDNNVSDITLNVGNPYPISILDLAKLIIKSTNTVAGYTFGKKYKYEPYVRIPDISLITKICGWKPKLTLEEGIKKTIEWFISGGMEKYEDKRKNIA